MLISCRWNAQMKGFVSKLWFSDLISHDSTSICHNFWTTGPCFFLLLLSIYSFLKDLVFLEICLRYSRDNSSRIVETFFYPHCKTVMIRFSYAPPPTIPEHSITVYQMITANCCRCNLLFDHMKGQTDGRIVLENYWDPNLLSLTVDPSTYL